jgi:S1-C subfamily serine protease
VGQKVFAIGNPFGLDQSLTTGVISALGREIESMAQIPIRDVIQTDAAINPGNSGGPLLDSAGRLVGINTAIYSPSGAYAGIGFAIPVDTVNWVVPDLIAHGKLKRPALGIQAAGDYVTRRLGIDGVLVLEVLEGSGAQQAGLRPTRRNRFGQVELGDVIVDVDGQTLHSTADLILLLEKRQLGDRVTLTILRNGAKQQVICTLEEAR